MKQNKIFNLKTNQLWLARLNKAAKLTEQPAAQIVRVAVNEKLQQLAEQNPRLAKEIAEIELALEAT